MSIVSPPVPQPRTERGPSLVAAALRALIDGAPCRLDAIEPWQAAVLVIDLQGALQSEKDLRQRWPRERRKRLRSIAKQIESQIAAVGEMQPAHVVEPLRLALHRARREAAGQLVIADAEIAKGDPQRADAVRSIRDAGLSVPEIADLVLATDGISDWRTGARAWPPSDYLRRYVDLNALPRRVWTPADANGIDGRQKLIDALKKLSR